jgi:hypothetical protein
MGKMEFHLIEWAPILTLVGVNAALFGSALALLVWFRTESRADWRHIDNKIDVMKDLIVEIQKEMKDFHGRLYLLEEKFRSK